MELQIAAGLPISMDIKGGLILRAEHFAGRPSVRTLDQLRPVLADPQASGPVEVYFMYRNVCLPQHRRTLELARLRYDITVILPAIIGSEFAKTAGHYHPPAPDSTDPAVTYPEVYEVLHGQARYLLQKPGPDGTYLQDIVLVEAGPGDKVVIPPGYGHITVNPGPQILIMANWVERNFSSSYDLIRDMRGGGYYKVREPQGARWIPNNRYRRLPEMRRVRPRPRTDLGLVPGTPMYTTIARNPERAEFLVYPGRHLDKLKPEEIWEF